MADGDDGVLGGMPLTPGSLPANQIDTELNKVHDYIANGPTYWKPGIVVPLTRGGTGATTAPAARTALGLPAAGADTAATGGTLVQRYPGGEIDAKQFATAFDPTTGNHCTRRSWVESYVSGVIGSGYLPLSGGTLSGHLWVPNSVPANIATWTVAYINGDGRLSRGASSERFKDDITAVDPLQLGDVFPQLHSFVMKDDPTRTPHLRWIAERLAESKDQRRFVGFEQDVQYDDDGNVTGVKQAKGKRGKPVPQSIDEVSLLIAQTAVLHARLQKVEAELADLKQERT